jgi:hypothetical protein
MPDTPDPAICIAEIREDVRSGWTAEARDRIREVHVPALLAAVEGVLAQHQPGRAVILGALCTRHEAHRHFSITSAEAADVMACPDCAAAVYVSCTGCGPQVPLDSCPARVIISRELSGKRRVNEANQPED